MASFDDKRFPPTKRKLKAERKKGNVWFSTEFASALFLGCAFLTLIVIFNIVSFGNVFVSIFTHLNELTIENALNEAFKPLLFSVIVFFIACFIFAILVFVVQRGWIWVWKKPSGSKKGASRYLFILLKLVLGVAISYGVLRSIHPSEEMIFSTPLNKAYFLYKKVFFLCLFLLLGFLVLSILDLTFQRLRFLKNMRMTKQEMDEEKKEAETKK